jgi:hypothetical protein
VEQLPWNSAILCFKPICANLPRALALWNNCRGTIARSLTHVDNDRLPSKRVLIEPFFAGRCGAITNKLSRPHLLFAFNFSLLKFYGDLSFLPFTPYVILFAAGWLACSKSNANDCDAN